MNDLISRQAAIEVIDAVMPVDPNKREYASGIACGAALAMTYVKQLPSAQPEQKWIPCSERLPEHEQEVLVTRHFLSDNQLKKNAITESFYVEVASWMDDEWTSYSDEYKIKRHLHKVIAWMPLPKPWKGEEK